MEKQKRVQEKPPGLTKRRWQIAGAVIALCILLLAGGFAASYYHVIRLPKFIQANVDLLPEINARTGTPNAKEGAATSGGEFQVVINQTPTIKIGAKTCNIQIENPKTNDYDLRLVLTLAESGEQVGQTHRIQRGQNLGEISLKNTFKTGEHVLTATYELYDVNKAFVGSLAVPITLRVVE